MIRPDAARGEHLRYQSIFRSDRLAGQTVVVTGGGTGIGRCTAHELAALGRPRQPRRSQARPAVVRTNLVGGFLMAKETHSRSMRENGGAVVNVTADHGRGNPLMGRRPSQRGGARVRCIARLRHLRRGAVPRPAHRLPALTLARRHGTESQISAAIVFLLSEAAAYFTGQELLVAGGADLVTGLWPVPDHDRPPPYHGFHRGASPAALGPGQSGTPAVVDVGATRPATALAPEAMARWLLANVG